VTFEKSDLAALAAAEEIRIETRSAAGAEHRTIVWVAEHDGTVYIRSVNGAGARWYREATAAGAGEAAVHLDGRRIPVRLTPATDAASVEACSEGLRAKYRRSYSLRSMLVDDVLDTTLRVEPA
jgi:hypothetical protein